MITTHETQGKFRLCKLYDPAWTLDCSNSSHPDLEKNHKSSDLADEFATLKKPLWKFIKCSKSNGL